jgi:DNA-binding transcriptional LysR family regulator
VRLPAADRALVIVPVFREPLVAVLPQNHALAGGASVALRALRDETLVLFPRRHAPGYYDFLTRVCRQSGLIGRLVHESEKLQTIVSLVAMGRGVALMPKCVVNLARKGVVCRSFRPRVADTELALVYDPANGSDLVQAFVGLARDIFLKTGVPLRGGTRSAAR